MAVKLFRIAVEQLGTTSAPLNSLSTRPNMMMMMTMTTTTTMVVVGVVVVVVVVTTTATKKKPTTTTTMMMMMIYRCYIALFSALEQTHCAHVACECE